MEFFVNNSFSDPGTSTPVVHLVDKLFVAIFHKEPRNFVITP